MRGSKPKLMRVVLAAVLCGWLLLQVTVERRRKRKEKKRERARMRARQCVCDKSQVRVARC